MELCKEKNEDRVWIDEIAAMEAYSRPDLPYLATSGIVLASDPHEHNRIDTSDGSLDAQGTSNDIYVFQFQQFLKGRFHTTITAEYN